jgi:hypothetical protein
MEGTDGKRRLKYKNHLRHLREPERKKEYIGKASRKGAKNKIVYC